MQQKKTTCWDGVRNFQAQKFMNQMKKGDLGAMGFTAERNSNRSVRSNPTLQNV
jgi:predicted RNA-binding protein with PUA-like domain